MLRRIGCTLPIELWYLGRHELPEKLEEFLSPLVLGVECVDGHRLSEQFPSRILNGWKLKPYSILHSKFAEVIALDADNVPVVDPTFLFWKGASKMPARGRGRGAENACTESWFVTDLVALSGWFRTTEGCLQCWIIWRFVKLMLLGNRFDRLPGGWVIVRSR